MGIMMLMAWFLFLSPNAKAEVRESSSMADVFRSIDADTLVVFDLDNTVMEAHGDWGSDQWYDHLVEYYKRTLPEKEAVARAEKEWGDAQFTTHVRPVEGITPELIRKAQDAGTKMIGLTARPTEITARTVEQLATIGVDFSRNGGAVFAIGATSSKGKALVEYLKRTGQRPKKIVFVDDKHHYVKSVDEALAELGIPREIFRYGGADYRVADYQSRVCADSWGAVRPPKP